MKLLENYLFLMYYEYQIKKFPSSKKKTKKKCQTKWITDLVKNV